MIKAAIYPRVSTSKQEREGYSIGEQIERLTKYCEAMGWTVYKTYTDAGFSGGNMDRPGLQALIHDAEQKRFDKVVVYKLDRLSRSQLDTLYLIERVFTANGVDFVSMSENFDTGTPLGRATIGVLATFAQLEKDQIRERMTMGKDAKLRAGYWMGTRAPMGYGYDKQTKRLFVQEEEAAQVREMFNLFIAGIPLRDIETRFSERGYTLRGRPWRLFSIRYMLDNKTYAGYVRGRDGWQPGAHEAIISEDTWEQAHTRMEQNRQRFAETGVSMNGDTHSTLLGGLIYCKRCGARYGKRQAGNPGNRWQSYICYSRMKSARQMVRDPNCRNKIYRTDDLDALILGEISAFEIAPDKLDAALQKTQNEPDLAEISAQLKTQISRIEKQISRLIDLYSMGRFSAEQLDDKINDLERQKMLLESQLADITDGPAVTAEEITETIRDLRTAIGVATRQELRTLIEKLIERIDIDGDDIYITWAFA